MTKFAMTSPIAPSPIAHWEVSPALAAIDLAKGQFLFRVFAVSVKGAKVGAVTVGCNASGNAPGEVHGARLAAADATNDFEEFTLRDKPEIAAAIRSAFLDGAIKGCDLNCVLDVLCANDLFFPGKTDATDDVKADAEVITKPRLSPSREP